ncbi:surface-adhesin E family protein [Sulfurirhabdus autotrophica]|uniref:Surface-adhesin protein E-like domain-containing protein n=1 Tax=Sulfurirhabdus autotrophica TaxID=1706046 RepID=A0A4R3YAG1_9PROT|nr:surface-adhesin E family protein [Sulfurirhabdus autotrophica]TCV88987.1 hypothetical protein EDC63_10358 [Sulfurirhabdus autotrophica]
MSRVFFNLAILLFLFGVKTAHAAEEWVTITTNTPNITFSVDKGDVKQNGENVEFWEKLQYREPEIIDQASGKKIKEKKVRRIINCKERTQGYSYGITYAEGGRFITSISLEAAQIKMDAIPPGTIAEEEFAMVCPKKEAPGKKALITLPPSISAEHAPEAN